MRRTIEAINADRSWKYGGTTFELRVRATADWKTSDGQFWLRGGHSLKDTYLSFPGEITGGDIPQILTLELDSTDDAIVNPSVKYWAEIVTERGKCIPWTVAGQREFVVPSIVSDDPPVLTWLDIDLHNELLYSVSRTRLRIPEYTSLLNHLLLQFNNLIAIAVGTLNDASEVIKGRTKLSVAPIGEPVAVGDNDPRLLQLPLERGIETLVDGEATVLSSLVDADSNIQITSQDDGVSGIPRAPVTRRVNNVSFDIVSTNEADAGAVGWVLYA